MLRKIICQVHVDEKSLLGDLVVSREGTVYVSDTHNNRLLSVTSKGAIATFSTAVEWQNIQGLTLDDTGRFLFVADYLKGLCRIELATKRIMWLRNATEASAKGIDGLEYYRGSLIAIQNGVYPFRVMRFFLDTAHATLVRYEVLDWAHPAFDEPTNGTIVGDTLYYVANSCWSGYDANQQLKESTISRGLILKVGLR